MGTKEKIRELEILFKKKNQIEIMMNDPDLMYRIHDLSFDLGNSSIKSEFFVKLHDTHLSITKEITEIIEK